MKKISRVLVASIFLMLTFADVRGQSSISIKCPQLDINKKAALQPDIISEDDPNDLAEAWSYLISYFGKGSDQRFELRFPAKKKTYHWTQRGVNDKNDSLSAELFYDRGGDNDASIDAFAKDFSISITRYDSVKGGIIEGTFQGTMEAYLPSSQKTVTIPVNGNFHTTRNGKGAECRKQRHAEKEVIDKAVSIFDEVIRQPITNLKWVVADAENGRTSPIANNPSPYSPYFCAAIFIS